MANFKDYFIIKEEKMQIKNLFNHCQGIKYNEILSKQLEPIKTGE